MTDITHHGVFVGAAHALGGVSLDPEEGEEVVGWSERSSILHRVRCHVVPLLPDVHPPEE